MKSYFLHAVVLGVFCSIFAASATASYISVNPSSPSIGLSDTTSVDIIAVMDPGVALSGFGMTVTIQDSGSTTSDVVDVSSASVGAGFTLTSPISISSFSYAEFVDVFATTTSAALTGNVILATITFDAMNIGTSIVGLGTHQLYDAAGAQITPESPQSGSITVSQNGGTVPEPTTLVLMGLGIAGIGWKRRKAT